MLRLMEVCLAMVRVRSCADFYFGYCFMLMVMCMIMELTLDNYKLISGSSNSTSNLLIETSSNGKCSVARRTRKGWKRRDFLQQRARQERLNNSRKWKGEDHEIMTLNVAEKCTPCKPPVIASESLAESASSIIKDLDGENIHRLAGQADTHILLTHVEDDKISSSKGFCGENCSCIIFDSVGISKECDDSQERNTSAVSSLNGINEQDEDSSSEASKTTPKSKRHSDRDLDNPKPSKSRRPVSDHSNLSCKYSSESFCSISDRLPDGFYDAGRDRPFMSLQSYEKSLCLDSREVILVDR